MADSMYSNPNMYSTASESTCNGTNLPLPRNHRGSGEKSHKSAPAAYTTLETPEPNPHGTLSFGKLTSMKIVDRFSVYAVGIKKSDAFKPVLSKYEFFGQFGPITSTRIIQKTSPVEVYLRFLSIESAEAAISWCRNTLGIDADHGYHKYCIKFINNKTCRRLNCPNRHSWCHDQGDIMTKHDIVDSRGLPIGDGGALPRQQPPPPMKQQHNAVTAPALAADHPRNRIPRLARNQNLIPHGRQSPAPPSYPAGCASDAVNTEAVRMLQAQFGQLQIQHQEQNAFILKLVKSHKSLLAENQRLKRERSQRAMMTPPLSMTSSIAPSMSFTTRSGPNYSVSAHSHSQSWSSPPQYAYVQPTRDIHAPSSGHHFQSNNGGHNAMNALPPLPPATGTTTSTQLMHSQRKRSPMEDLYGCGDIVDSIIFEDAPAYLRRQ